MIDVNSDTWAFIKKTLTEGRSQLIVELIREDDDKIRGRIHQIDEILDLPNKKPEQIVPAVNYFES